MNPRIPKFSARPTPPRGLPGSAGRAPSRLLEVGRVAAGAPLEAIEHPHGDKLLELLGQPGRYALRVADDSMCDAGILAGDFVVIQSQQRACSGDIVAASLDSEGLALHRIRLRGDNRVQLLPDNPRAKTRLLDASRVAVHGKVVGLLRLYR